LTKQIARFTPH
jgi:AcrR family transcriptional regulator